MIVIRPQQLTHEGQKTSNFVPLKWASFPASSKPIILKRKAENQIVLASSNKRIKTQIVHPLVQNSNEEIIQMPNPDKGSDLLKQAMDMSDLNAIVNSTEKVIPKSNVLEKAMEISDLSGLFMNPEQPQNPTSTPLDFNSAIDDFNLDFLQ